jgi:glycosyltransferase involved in cell wall biosynthesis
MKPFVRLKYEIYECCGFIIKLIKDVGCRVRKPVSNIRRVAIVTRNDLFPTNHGGAVKIVNTAKYLSFHYDEVLVVTQSRNVYFVFKEGKLSQHVYPLIAIWAFWIPFRYLRRKIDSTGFPQCDKFMAIPFFDKNFKFRLLYLAIRKPFEVLQAEFSFFVYACDWVSKIYPELTKLVVEHNIEFRRIGDTYNLSNSDIKKIKKFEIKACRSSDHVVVVSEADKDILLQSGVEASRLSVIPLGVDLAEYTTIDHEAVNALKTNYGFCNNDYIIMFHGVLSYKPNFDAVRLIVQEIMPRLRVLGCHFKCLLVGKNPPTEFAADDIIFTGAVEKLAPFIQVANVGVIPLLEGGGTRLKILEYFAAGVPVISTKKGAEGIKAQNGNEILIEDSMSGIANLIYELRYNPAKREIIGKNGRKFVQSYGWDKIAEEYCRLYDKKF